MDKDRLKKLEQLFEEAILLEEPHRSAYIDKHCGEDALLKKEVGSLIKHAGNASGFFDQLKGTVSHITQVEPTPEQVGPYRINRILGKGGMGTVYEGQDPGTGKPVAIKCLSSFQIMHDVALNRFKREISAIGKLNHPNVCKIIDFDLSATIPYLVMPFIKGVPLSTLLEEGPLPYDRAISLCIALFEGLRAAHQHGIVHRDIKPANLMITPDDQLIILDFGVAKMDQEGGLTQTGDLIGTLNYMSPEQIKGEKVDHRTDQWSAGAVLYEMLSGKRPYADKKSIVQIAIALEQEPFERLSAWVPTLPDETDAFVDQLLARSPQDRFASSDDVLEQLSLLRTLPPASPDRKKPPRPYYTSSTSGKNSVRKAPWFVVTMTMLGFTLLLLTAYVLKSAIDAGNSSRVDDFFTRAPFTLKGMQKGDAVFFDYNNDGIDDLITSGETRPEGDINRQTILYRFEEGEFKPAEIAFPGLLASSIVVADFNGDHIEDLVLAGRRAEGETMQVDSSSVFYYEGNGNTFELKTASLQPFWRGLQIAADFDLDGDNDLFYAGRLEPGPAPVEKKYVSVSALYKNQNHDFVDSEVAFPALDLPIGQWVDVDSDSDPDLFLSGVLHGQDEGLSLVYLNHNGTLEATEVAIPATDFGDHSWCDIDQDGDLDVALIGRNLPERIPFSEIYLNNEGTFTPLKAGLAPAYRGQVLCVDVNGDQTNDLLIFGQDENHAAVSRLYLQEANLQFTHTDIALPSYPEPVVAWSEQGINERPLLFLSGYHPRNGLEAHLYYIDQAYRQKAHP